MSKKILLLLLALVLLAAGVFAQQQLGCCCDPVVRTGSIMYQSVCTQPFIFIPIPSIGFQGCNALCNATNITAPPVTPPAAGCASPGYTPPVSNFVVRPVKGDKAVEINFNIPCPANSVKFYRCAGSGCSNFSLIQTLGQVNQFVDDSSDLLWDEDYTYKVVADYKISGLSDPAVDSVNTGDIECWYQTTNDLFCVAPFYYDQFKDYLKAEGYKVASASDFMSGYASTRDSVFNDFYGKSWFCNAVNVLSRPAPQVSCPDDEICVSDGASARCIEQVLCDVGGPFGLIPSVSSCEQDAVGNPKYCFVDKSRSIADKCYACDPKMKCYDYHSKDACLRDSCGAGQCAWTDVFPGLGVGVCYDTRFDACSLCQAEPSLTATNKEGFNEVFDACTEEKAAALSTPAEPCFFDKNTLTGKSCDFVDCTVYSQSQCGSPSGGIQLNPDNSIKVGSNDPCNIGVCQYSASTGCVKNTDGTSGAGWQDCLGKPGACEKDYFPPETLAAITGDAPGRQDYIDFTILDKATRAGRHREMQGKPGYKTYLCVVSGNASCSNAAAFGTVTDSPRLLINDLSLQDGQDVIANLRSGDNTIKFYSVDPYNNLEVVKSVKVFACEQCTGPKAVNVSVSDSNFVKGKYYTNSVRPSVRVLFDGPARVTASSLDKAGILAPLSISPSSGFNSQYSITLNSPLSPGRYTFSLNAEDDTGVQMGAPVIFDLVVDTTPPSVSISPRDGAEFDVSDVSVSLDFSEPVLFNRTVLNEVVFVDEYFTEEVPVYLAKVLNNANDTSFSGVVSGLRAGLKVLDVRVTDYAGNRLRKRSYFSVFAGPPRIRMKHPDWGITSVYTFNVTIESSTKTNCRYIADVPSAPPADQWSSFNSFDSSDGILHVIDTVSVPYGSTAAYPLHVYCRNDENTTVQSFFLRVDSVAPSIVSAYANPDPVVEPVEFGANTYSTRLQVQTNEPGFCRYSSSQQDFNLMEGVFPGFDKDPKVSHSVEINVSEVKGYTYYVACKDRAGLVSQSRPVTFAVDLDVPFAIKSATPKYSSTELFNLRVDSNKRAFCYFGESPGAITNCFGACEFTNGHSQPVQKPRGIHKFYVKCNTGSGGEASSVLNVSVVVDNSAPVMEFVDDSSTLPGEPDVSWYPDRLRVRFLGKEPESRIVKYWYLLETAFARELVVNWTPSLELNGSPVYVKADLTDGQRYVFRVKAENIAGLVGNYSSSDGVTIDTSRVPPVCADGFAGPEETDIDCGGICDACGVGRRCKEDGDCELLYCDEGFCREPSCSDGITNGGESDVDCGGPCAGCGLNKTCAVDSDCDSGNCRFGVCDLPDPCENGRLDGSESDVDCGGSCPNRCLSGENCNMQGDCQEGLACVENTCGEPRDLDKDGVLDHIDKCPDTAFGDTVDDAGCSLAQVFSCGDPISDAWRLRSFGSVLCDEDGAPDADPDDDGLTNLEEYRLQTNGGSEDTDDDGWSDGREFDKGTNPLDAADHPTSLLWILFKWLLILAVLAGIGYGGYYAYQKGYVEKVFEKFRRKPKEAVKKKPAAPKKPVPPEGPSPEEKIAALRRFARKKEAAEEEEFVPVGELKKKRKKPAAFKKLKKISKKPKKKKPKKKSKEEAIEKLRKIKK